MKRVGVGLLVSWLVLLSGTVAARAADDAEFTRKEDVIYGRKYGTALTMDVFTPRKDANGAAIIWVVSGGWRSAHENISAAAVSEFLKRGYTVFAVVHGSQPRYTVPEIVEDMHRATRFIRYHAKEYGIDPDRIGITGGSAGGHLSLMQGTAGDKGKPDAKDPVERTSSRVQAVACFFPPTDFLNYGEKGKEVIGKALRPPFTAAGDYHEYDKDKALFVPITDEKRLREITRQISPIYHVTSDDAPTLIIHGDKDALVPLQQAEIMIDKLKEAKVPAELVVKKGAGHGWPDIAKDRATLADWFDKYLKK